MNSPTTRFPRALVTARGPVPRWAPPQHTAPLRPHAPIRHPLPEPGVRALGCSWLLPPPWQAALRLAVPPDLLHLGPLDVLHVGLDHLWGRHVRVSAARLPRLLLSGLRQRRRQSAGTRRQPRGVHGPPVRQGRPGKTEGGQAGQHPPLCAAGAAHCTPSSSPTPAPPAGKLEDTSHPPLQVTACSGLACWGRRAADKPTSGAHPGDTSRQALKPSILLREGQRGRLAQASVSRQLPGTGGTHGHAELWRVWTGSERVVRGQRLNSEVSSL